jgi:hypothetical protein
MSSEPCITPAPVGQQGPPTRVAAFDSWRSLRDAHGPLLLATGTVPCLGTQKPKNLSQPWQA